MIPTCAECYHSKKAIGGMTVGGPEFICTRYPPQVVAVDRKIVQVFPEAIMACGEFKYEGLDPEPLTSPVNPNFR